MQQLLLVPFSSHLVQTFCTTAPIEFVNHLCHHSPVARRLSSNHPFVARSALALSIGSGELSWILAAIVECFA